MIITEAEAERIEGAIRIAVAQTYKGNLMEAEPLIRGIFLEVCREFEIDGIAKEFAINVVDIEEESEEF